MAPLLMVVVGQEIAREHDRRDSIIFDRRYDRFD
jgi:hypothetical protein